MYVHPVVHNHSSVLDARGKTIFDTLTDANNSRRVFVNLGRDLFRPLAQSFAALVVREDVEAVDRDDERNVQTPAQQRGSVSARQGGMGMNKIDALVGVRMIDLRTECAG